MPIVATAGDAAANSYLTIEEADTILGSHPRWETWVEATDQEMLLIQACILMDQLDYVGDPFTATQALKWPRWYEDEEELIRNYPTNTIPMPIKRAQAEWALYLEETKTALTATAGTVDTLKIGSSVEIKREFGEGAETTGVIAVDYADVPLGVARHLKGLRLHAVLA